MDNLRDLRYRAYVGPADKFDLLSANQFSLLVALGLRDKHYLLDIGCGSLGGGRLFIPYLLPNRYHGIEPLRWLIQEGISNEIGQDILRIKRPTFSFEDSFNLRTFNRKFDFVLAHSIFPHTPKSQIWKCLSEVVSVIKPDGIFAATFFKGPEDYEGDSWVYPDFVTYTKEYMMSVFKDNGFFSKIIEWPHPCNEQWIVACPENAENRSRIEKIPLFTCTSL